MTIEYGDTRLPEKFWIKVHVVPEMSCWVWTGAMKKHGNYPVFTLEGKVTTVLQVLSRIFYPHDREKLKPKFTCGNTQCANPNHVTLVDKKECVNGHIARRYTNGGNCSECSKVRGRARTRKSRAGLGQSTRKPKGPTELTVFGDRPPGKVWRPSGWSEKVKVN